MRDDRRARFDRWAGRDGRWVGARSNRGNDRARSNRGSDRVGDGRVRVDRSSRGTDRRARSSRGKDSGRFGQKVKCRKGYGTKLLRDLWWRW